MAKKLDEKELVSLVAEIIGHQDITITKKYTHPTPEFKMKAVETLCQVPSKVPTVAELGHGVEAGNSLK